jgi:hypothetical protein
MNPELLALYKKFPWMIQLHDKIESVHVLKVEVLDMESITRFCGTLPIRSGDYYTTHGYLVSNGRILREVYEPDGMYSFLLKLAIRIFKKYPNGGDGYVALDEMLRTYKHADIVTHVVLYGRDLFSSHDGTELTVYSLPQGKTMKDMLTDLDALCTPVELMTPAISLVPDVSMEEELSLLAR